MKLPVKKAEIAIYFDTKGLISQRTPTPPNFATGHTRSKAKGTKNKSGP